MKKSLVFAFLFALILGTQIHCSGGSSPANTPEGDDDDTIQQPTPTPQNSGGDNTNPADTGDDDDGGTGDDDDDDTGTGDDDDAGDTITNADCAPSFLSAPLVQSFGETVNWLFTADFDGNGQTDIAYVNNNYDEDGTSDLMTVILYTDACTIKSTAQYSTLSDGSWAVNGGDVDSNGSTDLVITNSSSSTVTVLRNAGDGTFTAEGPYAVGSSPFYTAIGDLNEDGFADLVVASSGTDSFFTFLNDGDGTFDESIGDVEIGLTGYMPTYVTLEDIDGDSHLDIILANTSGTDDNIEIFINNAVDLGAFAAPGTSIDVDVGVQFIALADLDGDGDLDAVSANHFSNTMSLLTNTSTSGTLNFNIQTGPLYDVDGNEVKPQAVYLTDLNGDALTDIFVVSESDTAGNAFQAFLNATTTADSLNFTSTGPQSIYGGSYPLMASLTDWDSDGDLDALIATTTGENIVTLWNDGTGNFAVPVEETDITIGDGPLQALVADMNGDGKLDRVVAYFNNKEISVQTNTGSGFSESFIPDESGFTNYYLNAGDLDGDGYTDLSAIYNDEYNYFNIDLYNPSSGTFSYLNSYGNIDFSFFTLSDIDGDSDLDCLGLSNDSDDSDGAINAEFAILLNNGATGTALDFDSSVIYDIGFNGFAMTTGDFDADGDVDIVISNPADNSVTLLTTSPDTDSDGFPELSLTTGAVGANPGPIATTDFNGDSKLDIVVANRSDNTLSLALNTGVASAPFDTITAIALNAESGPQSLNVTDLDGDGDNDIVTSSIDDSATTPTGGALSVLLNDGDANFTLLTYGISADPMASVGDFDGDGDVEIVVTDYTNDQLFVVGNSTF